MLDFDMIYGILARVPEGGDWDLEGSDLYTRATVGSKWIFRGTVRDPQDVRCAWLELYEGEDAA